MALSDREFEILVKQLERKKERLGEDGYNEFLNRVAEVQTEKQDVDDDSFGVNLGQGVAKSAGSIGLSVGKLGRGIQRGISKGVDKVFGTEGFGLNNNTSVFDEGSAANQKAEQLLERDNAGEKVGGFVGDVASFAIPGAGVVKATKGTNFLTRAAALGTTDAGVTAAQQGEVDEAAAINFFLGAAGPVVGKGLSMTNARTALTEKLPEWLVEPLLKQAKDAKIKRSNLPQFLVSTGRVGNVETLVNKTNDAISDIGARVQSALKEGSESGVTVNRDELFDRLVQQVNDEGGAIDLEQVTGVVNRLAPQAQGLLKKEVLDLDEANRIRSQIDKTLGDRGFLRDQLPFDKDLLRGFTNELREEVKTKGPTQLRGLFDDYAKNIRLRDALLDRANSGGRTNNIGLSDLIAGGVGFGGGGPIGAAVAFGARRVVESPQFRTNAAKFMAGGGFESLLEKSSPQARAVLLELAEQIENSTDLGETN